MKFDTKNALKTESHLDEAWLSQRPISELVKRILEQEKENAILKQQNQEAWTALNRLGDADMPQDSLKSAINYLIDFYI